MCCNKFFLTHILKRNSNLHSSEYDDRYKVQFNNKMKMKQGKERVNYNVVFDSD